MFFSRVLAADLDTHQWQGSETGVSVCAVCHLAYPAKTAGLSYTVQRVPRCPAFAPPDEVDEPTQDQEDAHDS